ncbi:MAG: hypothetical protein PARBA_03251 [Parabacteroides sp.]
MTRYILHQNNSIYSLIFKTHIKFNKSYSESSQNGIYQPYTQDNTKITKI